MSDLENFGNEVFSYEISGMGHITLRFDNQSTYIQCEDLINYFHEITSIEKQACSETHVFPEQFIRSDDIKELLADLVWEHQNEKRKAAKKPIPAPWLDGANSNYTNGKGEIKVTNGVATVVCHIDGKMPSLKTFADFTAALDKFVRSISE
jgi:hypothetical protein